VRVVAPPAGGLGVVGAVVVFTAHTAVATAVPAAEVLARLPPGDIGAPAGAACVAWLAGRLDAVAGGLDAVLLTPAGAAEAGALPVRTPHPDPAGHPRAALARRRRREVTVSADPDGRGLVALGTGRRRQRQLRGAARPAVACCHEVGDRGAGRDAERLAPRAASGRGAAGRRLTGRAVGGVVGTGRPGAGSLRPRPGASRLRDLSAEEVLERPDERLRLLTGGDRAALPRRQTPAATATRAGLRRPPGRRLRRGRAGLSRRPSAAILRSVRPGCRRHRDTRRRGSRGAAHRTLLPR
jgi:hypothetical protein